MEFLIEWLVNGEKNTKYNGPVAQLEDGNRFKIYSVSVRIRPGLQRGRGETG